MLRERNIGVSQFLVILFVAVVLILVWDFGRRIIETVRLIQAAQQAERELREAERINAQLIQLKQDILTDAWVERKARSDLHYAKENETLFVPIATRPIAPPTPPPLAIAPPAPARPFWQDWLEWLFGPTPLLVRREANSP